MLYTYKPDAKYLLVTHDKELQPTYMPEIETTYNMNVFIFNKMCAKYFVKSFRIIEKNNINPLM